MSDLISRKALLEELEAQDYYGGFLVRLITNAPTVEQGEPVAIVDEVATSWNGKHIFNAVGKVNVGDKLYAAQPQPQTVKDALEKAARICNDYAKGYDGQMEGADYDDFIRLEFAKDSAVVIREAIRALIED